MAGQAAAVLAGADLIPSWGYQLWDTSWILSQDSLAGRALRALIGYSDRPMGVQLAVYAVTLATLIVGSRIAHTNLIGSQRHAVVAARPAIGKLRGRQE
jgi:high-affinity iron transporter